MLELQNYNYSFDVLGKVYERVVIEKGVVCKYHLTVGKHCKVEVEDMRTQAFS